MLDISNPFKFKVSKQRTRPQISSINTGVHLGHVVVRNQFLNHCRHGFTGEPLALRIGKQDVSHRSRAPTKGSLDVTNKPSLFDGPYRPVQPSLRAVRRSASLQSFVSTTQPFDGLGGLLINPGIEARIAQSLV